MSTKPKRGRPYKGGKDPYNSSEYQRIVLSRKTVAQLKKLKEINKVRSYDELLSQVLSFFLDKK